jgi:hypothetical protein
MTPARAGDHVELRQLYERRLARVAPRMRAVFHHEDLDEPPIIVSSAFFWVAGLDPATLPDDYFTNPAAMTEFQERAYHEHLLSIDDDFVPYLMPWFGTGVVASALGCAIEFPSGQDPAVNPEAYPVTNAADVRKLRMPDSQKDGLMPRVLEFQRYMKAHSFLPVGITDLQGPLTTANQLMGYDKLIYLMADDPVAAHELMDKVTETLVAWVRAQKQVIGESLTHCAGGHQIHYGTNAGVWFSDDDCVLMSADSYRKFVVPCNSRLLEAFGGGSLHFCGKATHQADNFLATRGLNAVNNYTLYNLSEFHRLKEKLEGRIALFACDYSPADPERYFTTLLSGLSRRGLVVLSHYSPVIALIEGGKYKTRTEKCDNRQRILKRVRERARKGMYGAEILP